MSEYRALLIDVVMATLMEDKNALLCVIADGLAKMKSEGQMTGDTFTPLAPVTMQETIPEPSQSHTETIPFEPAPTHKNGTGTPGTGEKPCIICGEKVADGTR